MRRLIFKAAGQPARVVLTEEGEHHQAQLLDFLGPRFNHYYPHRAWTLFFSAEGFAPGTAPNVEFSRTPVGAVETGIGGPIVIDGPLGADGHCAPLSDAVLAQAIAWLERHTA